MPKAFISYVRADEAAAKRLAQELERRGIRAVSTDQLVAPGEAWTSKVETAISDSDLFFVLLSRESSRSEWLAVETGLAISLADQGRPRVIPVLVNRDAEIPPLLSHVQGLEFFDPEKSQQQLDVLIRSIDKGQPTERDRRSDLEAQRRYLQASRETLNKEVSIQASRRAAWSSTIAAATTALAAVIGGVFLLAVGLRIVDPRMASVNFWTASIDSRMYLLIRWALPFGLGVLVSILAFLLTAFLRRRLDSRQVQRGKQ